MKRLIALDIEEFNALNDLANASGQYIPMYQTVQFSTGMYYVFDLEDGAQIEKVMILGARAGLVSP